MMKIDFDKKDKKLRFIFDVQLPAALASQHREYLLFADSLGASADFEIFYTDDKNIGGLIVGFDGFIEFLKKMLPERDASFYHEMLERIRDEHCSGLGDGLKVNFHQRSFDTPERYWSFIFEQGNFARYFINRIGWYLCPKYTVVTPFPIHVDIESSSACNMSCPMCYRDMLREVGHMDIGVFKKIVDECAEHKIFSVRLSWRGETLTNPNIKEMIAYATKKIPNVSFLTNAFYLTEDMADCFINNKVSYIAVSFDGIKKTYESIRYPARFEENYKRLLSLVASRRGRKAVLPQVRLCTIWPAIRDDPGDYYQTMKDVSDYIVCNPYINFKGPMDIKPEFICQYPWERIVVAFNGKAQCCTGWNADDIVLGNVADSSIYDMWHSGLMERIRKVHADGKRMSLASCAVCRHGSKGDPNVRIKDILERKY